MRARSYLGTFLHGIVSISIICECLKITSTTVHSDKYQTDYLPVYFQACMDATPIRSSINVFATTLVVSPFSIICGVLVKVTNKYRPLNYIGWALSMIGCGLLTLLKADSHTSQWAGFQIVAAMGIGIVVRVFLKRLGCPPHHHAHV